jgi:hypothetical protein
MVYTVDLLGDANLRVRDLTITRNTYLANVVVDASADLNSVTTVGNTTTNSIEITSAQASTSKLTGALKVSGGVGVQGNVHVGSNLFVESNLEVGTANLFVDTTTGNVGIGTTNPQGLLHISSGTSGDAHLILEADTDNNNEADNPKIVFRQDGGFYTGEIGPVHNHLVFRSKSTSVTNTGFIFYSNVAPGQTSKTDLDDLEDTQVEVMRITGDGNVGIGTANPPNILTIKQPVPGGATGSSDLQSNAAISIRGHLDYADALSIGLFDVSDPITGNNPTGYIQNLWDNGGDGRPFVINPAGGNVGIGTTNPNCLLTVEGGTGVGSSGGVLGIRQKGDTLDDGITLTSSNVNSTRMYKDVNGHFNLYNTGGGIFTLENLTGNVGIGMTNPNVKLDVSGIATFRSQPGFQAWKIDFDLYDIVGTSGVLDGFTEQFDVNGDFNPTTGVFTAPEDGLYSFGINFSWHTGDGVDDTIWFLFEVDNNSTYGNRSSSTTEDFAMNPRFFSRSGTEYSTSHSTLERLESGATVNIYFHNVGTTLNNVKTTNFFGYKVS